MPSLLIVGAGFSAPAGFPVGSQLFPVISGLMCRWPALAEDVSQDIDRFLRYAHHTTGKDIKRNSLNLEEFMAFLDIEHALALRGGDTLTRAGNASHMIIRNLIAVALHECLRATTPEQRAPYLALASHLGPGDLIISFNYDTLIESVLDERNVAYRLLPDRLASVSEWGGVMKVPEEEVILLKVHGSIDWFDRSDFDETEAAWAKVGATDRPFDPVFTDPARCQVEPIVSGPYFPESPLLALFRARNIEPYLSESRFMLHAPYLVAPSAFKTLYIDPLKEFWSGFARVGGGFTRMAVIGFSLPPHDQYVRQPIYDLICNYQASETTPLGNMKSALLMADLRRNDCTKRAYRETYRFVDWERARVDFSGFSTRTIDDLFS